MSAAATNVVAAGTPAPADRGRNRITSKALTRVVAAVTADALGVDPKRVGADLADDKGRLVLTVTAPIRVVSLARVSSGSGVIDRSGGTVLERAARAQETIRSRVADITGSAIDRVTLRLSAADIQEEERVR